MKLRIQTLTGQVGEVEVDPQNTILDLKVSSTIKYMSQLRAGGPVIPCLLSCWPESVYASGRYGHLVHYGDEYYFYFMGGHTLTSLKGGRPCPLSTFNYGVVGHLAFQLTQTA